MTAVRTDRPSPVAGTARSRRLVVALGEGFADVRTAVSLALGVVALGLLVCVALVAAGWASDTASATPWPQVVRTGVDLWLVVHLGDLRLVSEVATSTSPADPLSVVEGSVSLAPLALVLAAGSLSWRAGRLLAARCGPARSLLLSLVTAASTGGAAWLLAWAVDTPVLSPSPTRCAVGAAALTLAGAVLGVLSRHHRDVVDRLPAQVRGQLARVLPASVVAFAAVGLAAALLLTLGLLLQLPTVTAVQGTLAPGVGGGVLLLLAQLAYLPTAVVWSGAVLAGPGVWLGEGAHVGPAGSTVIDVPAVPLLAAVPPPGAAPFWGYLGPLVVVASGALAGWYAHRHPSSRGATLVDRLGDAVVVAALVGLVAGAAARLASGSLGPWQPLGPDPLLLAAVVAAEVLVGTLVAGGVLHLLAGRPLVGRRGSRAR